MAQLFGKDSQDRKLGRPMQVVSVGFREKPLEEIVEIVDLEGGNGSDIVVLPEACQGQRPETLDGPTVTAMRGLARKHSTYVICPIYRREDGQRLNSAVLIDRSGQVAGLYDKAFPYWAELDLDPPVSSGTDAPVWEIDLGRIGVAICFDVNFPEVWQRLAEGGAEVVFWSSAYSAGTALRAYALMHHYYIVTSTLECDSLVYDITGEELLYNRGHDLCVTRVELDLDRGIYHTNFNAEKRDRLLAESANDVVQEKQLDREQWFVLRARRPGVSARALASQHGMEELRDYIDRSRQEMDRRRGGSFPLTSTSEEPKR